MPGTKRTKRDQVTSSKAQDDQVKDTKKKATDKEKQKTAKKEGSQQGSDEESDPEYEVDYIQGHKISKTGDEIEFWVKWKGYDDTDNTWESFEFFANDAPDMAAKYVIRAFNTFRVPS